jgi:cytoskeletal protein CcmA (bactofilin family)
VLSGRILGEVEEKNKVVLHKTANLQGNIRTPVLVVEEGAVLEGELVMGSLDTVSNAKPEKDSNPS